MSNTINTVNSTNYIIDEKVLYKYESKMPFFYINNLVNSFIRILYREILLNFWKEKSKKKRRGRKKEKRIKYI